MSLRYKTSVSCADDCVCEGCCDMAAHYLTDRLGHAAFMAWLTEVRDGDDYRVMLKQARGIMSRLEAYRKGYWTAPVPPVCTAYWDTSAWLRYIDAHGTWLTRVAP